MWQPDIIAVKVKLKLMEILFISYWQEKMIIKISLIFFVNYHRNNWLNHYFQLEN